ncbi:hypothetical protein [Bacillus nitratireducens]|uniref:hypothetical protein n=1 Tax=Bacillus nitratireducens TaxID=2026193 RepID=UPI002E1AB3BB|nr:hypothetical protein [Bacillus nitratireducens]
MIEIIFVKETHEEKVTVIIKWKKKKKKKKKWKHPLYYVWVMVTIIIVVLFVLLVFQKGTLDLEKLIVVLLGLMTLLSTWFAVEAKYNES